MPVRRTVGRTVCDLLVCNLAIGESSNVRYLSILQGSCGFSPRRSLPFLLVGCEVERDEEQEVRADYAHAGERREFLARAFARVGHPWEVG